MTQLRHLQKRDGQGQHRKGEHAARQAVREDEVALKTSNESAPSQRSRGPGSPSCVIRTSLIRVLLVNTSLSHVFSWWSELRPKECAARRGGGVKRATTGLVNNNKLSNLLKWSVS
jgi:hypothetical protein